MTLTRLRRRAGGAAVLATCILQGGGCSGTVDYTPADPVPAIQALLIAGQGQHAFWVEWTTPADQPYADTTRPVAASDVRLEIERPDGSTAAVIPDAAVPGRFTAALSIIPGEAYRLAGSVAGHVISASTTVPSPLILYEPAGDPIQPEAAGCTLLCDLPYRVSPHRGAGYGFFLASRDPLRGFEGATITRDTVGVIRLVARSSPSQLMILALDPAAAGFLGGTGAAGNITGAAGLFGSATAVYRTVVWP